MKKKRYKKLIKKLNKLMKLVESNVKTTVINEYPSWPDVVQPTAKPQEWEIHFTDPSLVVTTSN